MIRPGGELRFYEHVASRHLLKPEGERAIYLCRHAVRSKATLRNGAAGVAGGFVAWRRAGFPVDPSNEPSHERTGRR